MIFTGTIANSLKRTLESIVDDDMEDSRKELVMKDFFDEDTMDDNFIDFLEMGGPGLAAEKPEGAEIQIGSVREGTLTRVFSKTYAMRLVVTEEAMEDKKYPQAIRAGERLNRAMYKTVDYEAANQLIRAFNAAFPIGDGQPWFSTAHTLPAGGTFSNLTAVPLTPSRASLQVVTTQLRKMPGHDGLIDQLKPKCVVAPVEQEFIWKETLRSDYAPEVGQFNAINAMKRDYNVDLVLNPYWTTTSTNWIVLSNAKDGLKWFWRVRPRGRSWVNNDNTSLLFAIRARWGRTVVNARCAVGSNS